MEFYSAYNTPMVQAAPSGAGVVEEYGWEYDENGKKVLKVVGLRNMQEEINADLEASKIENIIARYTSGDQSAVGDPRSMVYMDLVEMPTSLAEAQTRIQKAYNYFEQLDPAEKARYNNSRSEFVAAFGSEKWAKTLGLVDQKAPISGTEQLMSAEGLKKEGEEA